MEKKKIKRLTEKVNVTILAPAKKVLTDYQDENNYASLDDSLSALLMEFKDHRTKMGELETRIKELEAELASLKESK